MIAKETGYAYDRLALSANNKDLPDCFGLQRLRDGCHSFDQAVRITLK